MVSHIDHLPKKDQRHELVLIKNMGIEKHNNLVMEQTNSTNKFIRAREGKHSKLVQCPLCKTFISANNKARHKCAVPKERGPLFKRVQAISWDKDDLYFSCLESLRQDKIGKVIRNNDFIIRIGRQFYNRYKTDRKLAQIEHRTRAFLRNSRIFTYN